VSADVVWSDRNRVFGWLMGSFITEMASYHMLWAQMIPGPVYWRIRWHCVAWTLVHVIWMSYEDLMCWTAFVGMFFPLLNLHLIDTLVSPVAVTSERGWSAFARGALVVHQRELGGLKCAVRLPKDSVNGHAGDQCKPLKIPLGPKGTCCLGLDLC